MKMQHMPILTTKMKSEKATKKPLKVRESKTISHM